MFLFNPRLAECSCRVVENGGSGDSHLPELYHLVNLPKKRTTELIIKPLIAALSHMVCGADWLVLRWGALLHMMWQRECQRYVLSMDAFTDRGHIAGAEMAETLLNLTG